MTTGTTTLLSLALPVDGELDGTWGDVVNYGITDYVDIAVAGTLTLNGDGAVTLANTTGTASGTNITSTTAQYAIIRITGTLTTTKVVTAPSYSKTYIVDNAATGGSVTFKAAGQTGVSVPVGEKVTVYYNGTDYVKISGGTVNLATQVTGVLPEANGGTNQSTYTTGDMLYASASNTLSKRTVGSTGQVLTVSAGLPTWATPASGLPSQTGNAGKYLTTDGSSASWTETGAAAGGSIYVNNTLISSNYTIASGQNGFSVGPITQAPGVTVTITAGQRWVVL
jgi:hypothetical protein